MVARCSRSMPLAAREHVYRTRNPNLFPDLRIPRSTSATWLRGGCPSVVSYTRLSDDVAAPRARIVCG